MNQRHQELADRVLAAFRAELDEADLQRIGEARFQVLHSLIGEALTEELDMVSGRLEVLLRELRSEAEKPELEL